MSPHLSSESMMNRCCAMMVVAVLLSSCYPSMDAAFLDWEPSRTDRISAPSKVFLVDGSVVVLPKGFTVSQDALHGTGERYSLGTDAALLGAYVIPVDSVAAITYYEPKYTTGEAVGYAMLGLYGSLITPLSLRCISCPKCCFGSCPTVYVQEGGEAVLKAELFSDVISRYTQRPDLDLLGAIPQEGAYAVVIANEALETHYIDQVTLTVVRHPSDSRVLPATGEKIALIGGFIQPDSAVNSSGTDVSREIRAADDAYYQTPPSRFEEALNREATDHVDVRFADVPEGDPLGLVLRLRNTLLGTVLLYDVILAPQGYWGLEWTQRMQTDRVYALVLDAMSRRLAGVRVKVLCDGDWVEVAHLRDSGPICWKEQFVPLPAVAHGPLRVRLEFFPDNFHLDQIALASEIPAEEYEATVLPPLRAENNDGSRRDDLLSMVDSADGRYLVAEPGHSLRLIYDAGNLLTDGKRTALLHSKGYYFEWIRGNWARGGGEKGTASSFDVDQVIQTLQKKWLESRDTIEESFFRWRVPVPGSS